MFGPSTAVFIKELGHRLKRVTGDNLSHHHLIKRLSVAVQREIVHQFWDLPGAETFHAFLLNFFYFCFSYSLRSITLYCIVLYCIVLYCKVFPHAIHLHLKPTFS